MAHGDGNENESLTTVHARPLLTHYHSSRAAKAAPTKAQNLVAARAGARGRAAAHGTATVSLSW